MTAQAIARLTAIEAELVAKNNNGNLDTAIYGIRQELDRLRAQAQPRPQTAYVVYHIESTMEKASYRREQDARRLAQKLGSAYSYATAEHYRTNVVYMVTRRNLQSGKEYQEPSNTPCYLSPASEAYWSM